VRQHVVYKKATFDKLPASFLVELKQGIEVPSQRAKFQADLVESVKQMRGGQTARVTTVKLPMAAEARASVGLSQQAFAILLDVSTRTLQDWEQGRREPTGAAKILLRIAVTHPEILRALQA
jgi:putative transcriptional regulator